MSGECEVRFEIGLYDIAAIKRAAYRLSDRAAVEIATSGSHVICTLRPIGKISSISDEVRSEFIVEVLDNDLRQAIAKETEPLRNLVLSTAFAKTGLQG